MQGLLSTNYCYSSTMNYDNDTITIVAICISISINISRIISSYHHSSVVTIICNSSSRVANYA